MRLIVRDILLSICLVAAASAAPGRGAAQSGAAQAGDEQALRDAMEADPEERPALLEKFLADHPKSPLRENARYQLALAAKDPAKRRAALERFLADFPSSRLKESARVQLIAATTDSGARIAAMHRFLEEFPNGEFREVVFPQLIDALARKGDSPELDTAVQEYIKGTADVPQGALAEAYGTAIEILSRHRATEARRNELVRQATGPVAAPLPAEMRSRFLSLLGRILYKYDAYDQADAVLRSALAAGMPDPPGETYFALGRICESRGDADGALENFLNAAARRGSREIKSAAQEAWKKKHGSLDGLHERLDTLMLARPKAFDPGKYKRGDGAAPGAVVLVEMFTGAECGPCIGSDLTADSLIDYFDRDTVVLLQYHVHAPGPDPLANPDTAIRARHYGVAGTPTAFVDGSTRMLGGGTTSMVPRLFASYRAKIDPLLKEAPGADFKDLALARDTGSVRVSGTATVPAGTASDRLRLHIALVEAVVHYTGGNGVHFHHFVVRKMLGPEDGIRFGDSGSVAFSESVNLEALSASLKEYLDAFEKNEAGQWPGFRFDEKPAAIDPAQVGAVVFVQNEDTNEVLNSRFAN